MNLISSIYCFPNSLWFSKKKKQTNKNDTKLIRLLNSSLKGRIYNIRIKHQISEYFNVRKEAKKTDFSSPPLFNMRKVIRKWSDSGICSRVSYRCEKYTGTTEDNKWYSEWYQSIFEKWNSKKLVNLFI